MIDQDTGTLGPAKILAAAAEAKVQSNDGTSARKILAAAGAAEVRARNGAGVEKILTAAREANIEGAIDPVDRVRRAAGKPSRAQEAFAKSLSAFGELNDLLHQPSPPAHQGRRWMPKPSRLAKALEGHSFVPLSAEQRRPKPPEAASRRFRWADRAIPLQEAGHFYYDFRDRLAADIRTGTLSPTSESLIDHAHRVYGLEKADAGEWTERFYADIARERERNPPQIRFRPRKRCNKQ